MKKTRAQRCSEIADALKVCTERGDESGYLPGMEESHKDGVTTKRIAALMTVVIECEQLADDARDEINASLVDIPKREGRFAAVRIVS